MSQPVALVTGCSEGGIGYSLARNLASRGYKVFATARKTSNMPGLAEAGCDVREYLHDAFHRALLMGLAT